MRPLIIVPLSCAITGLVLSLLCIFAGNKPGFMKEYPILTLNTSTIGHDILPKISRASLIPNSKSENDLPKITKTSLIPIQTTENDIITTIDDITDQINGIFNDIADDVTRDLGIQQFYNWHLRNFCEGSYIPNYKASNATFDVKYCSEPTVSYHFKIGDIIDRELRIGPLHIGLQNLQWPDAIQKNMDQLSLALHAALAFYGISITAIIFSLFTGLMVLFGSNSLLLSLITWGLLSASFGSLFVSSLIVSIVNVKAIKIVSETGNKIGVFALRGHKYLALTWCAMAVMLVAVLTFGAAMILERRSKDKGTSDKQ